MALKWMPFNIHKGTKKEQHAHGMYTFAATQVLNFMNPASFAGEIQSLYKMLDIEYLTKWSGFYSTS